MIKPKEILAGFFGGILGGIVVDLVYINFAGPSGLFTLLSITGRQTIFWGHAILGGILGILFVVLFRKLKVRKLLAAIGWGIVSLIFIGAIPTIVAGIPITQSSTLWGVFVWILYGLILGFFVDIVHRL